MNRLLVQVSLLLAITPLASVATDLASQQTTGVDAVFVNDNPANGVSCFTSKAPLNAGEAAIWANCSPSQGYLIAIPTNDTMLNIAIAAKIKASNTWILIDRSAGYFHCPGLGDTPCALMSIGIK